KGDRPTPLSSPPAKTQKQASARGPPSPDSKSLPAEDGCLRRPGKEYCAKGYRIDQPDGRLHKTVGRSHDLGRPAPLANPCGAPSLQPWSGSTACGYRSHTSPRPDPPPLHPTNL